MARLTRLASIFLFNLASLAFFRDMLPLPVHRHVLAAPIHRMHWYLERPLIEITPSRVATLRSFFGRAVDCSTTTGERHPGRPPHDASPPRSAARAGGRGPRHRVAMVGADVARLVASLRELPFALRHISESDLASGDADRARRVARDAFHALAGRVRFDLHGVRPDAVTH